MDQPASAEPRAVTAPRGRNDDSVLSATFDGTTETVGRARGLADEWLGSTGADAGLRHRVALVVSELTTNAVQAAAGRPYTLRLAAGERTGALSVSVESEASLADLPDPGEWGPETPLSPRGRGLAIVRALARSVRVTPCGDGRIRVTARLNPPGA